MKRLLAALLASALLLLALGPVFAQEKVESTPYYPLEVGNTWHYKVGENKYTMKVTKIEKAKVTKGGKDVEVPVARLEMTANKKVRSSERLAVYNGALCRFSLDGKDAKPPIPFLKVPPRPGGKAWAVESKIGKQLLKGKFRPCEKEVAVTVPAGTYKKAFRVTSEDLVANGLEIKLTYYFVEDVGLVKLEVDQGKRKVVFELEKFEKAGAAKAKE